MEFLAANECLERRTGRPDTELIRDRPEEELIREISLISEIKTILLTTLANIEQQQSDNRAIRQRMEFDWSEKKVAHENDAINCNLRNQSTNTLFKPGATRCSNECVLVCCSGAGDLLHFFASLPGSRRKSIGKNSLVKR